MINFLFPALWISQFGFEQGWRTYNENPRYVWDVDGDGKSDIIGFGRDGVYVSLSRGKDFAPPKRWLIDFAKYAGGFTNQNLYPRLVGDVNGDKKADIVGFNSAGILVSTSNTTDFTDSSLWSKETICSSSSSSDYCPRFLGDVNGDGKADVIIFYSNNIYIAFSNGNSFAKATYYYSTDFGSSYGWSNINLNPRWIEDVNGDGKADIIGFNADGVVVALSNGVNFDKATLWSWWFGSSADAGSWTNFDQFPRFVKDMNNDGKADIIGFGSAGIYIAYSNGKHFEEPFLAFSSFGAVSNGGGGNSYDRHPRLVMDVTGDGLFDIIGFGNSGTFVSVMIDDATIIKSINLNVIKAETSLCDVKCLSDCESNELETNCFDKCKTNSCEYNSKLDTSDSEEKFYELWAWILLFGVLGVAALACLTRKSSKNLYPEFYEGSEISYMTLK